MVDSAEQTSGGRLHVTTAGDRLHEIVVTELDVDPVAADVILVDEKHEVRLRLVQCEEHQRIAPAVSAVPFSASAADTVTKMSSACVASSATRWNARRAG